MTSVRYASAGCDLPAVATLAAGFNIARGVNVAGGGQTPCRSVP
jgi:hypothetical protein